MAKKIVKYVLTGLTIFFFGLSLAIMIVGIKAATTNKPMSLFGYVFSVVPTESMKPDINPGDFVFSKKVDFEELEVGDDVVYYSKDHNVYIVHRILRENPDGSFVMKGINNELEDTEFVTKDNYVSKVVKVFSFFHLGDIVLEHRSIIFGFLIFIFLGIVIIEVSKIFITIQDEKVKQKQIEREKNIKELTDQKYKELLEERGLQDKENLQEENEKAK